MFFNLNSEDTKIAQQYVLENGFQIFTKEDLSSPIVQIELVVKAGFSSQTKNTTGFFELYSKLFFSGCADNNTPSKVKQKMKELGIFNLDIKVEEDATYYCFSVPVHKFNSSLSFLKDCIMNPLFLTEPLKKELSEMQDEIKQKILLPETYINSSIDSKVFSKAPWKHDTGIYPGVFMKYSPEEARNILRNISRQFYVPNNSALFITGYIPDFDFEKSISRLFSSWDANYESQLKTASIDEKELLSAKNKKYILVSDDFSKDFTQAIIQYPVKGLSSASNEILQTALLADSFEADHSSFKKNMLSDKNIALHDETYIYTSFSSSGNSSRLIIQSLLENTSSPVKQTDEMIKNLKSEKNIQQKELEQSKTSFINDYNFLKENVFILMRSYAKNWVYYPSSFFENYPDLVNAVSKDNCSRLFARKPFVFLLVHPDIFQEYQDDFSKNEYEIITKENASWYTNSVYENIEKQKEDKSDFLTFNADQYLMINRTALSESTLSNGIPVISKYRKTSSSVCLETVIKGGFKANRPENVITEKIIVAAIAKTIKENMLFPKGTSIKYETYDSYSTISIECLDANIETVISLLSNAVLNIKFSPALLDSILWEVNQDWTSKSFSPGFQMYLEGIKQLYKGTVYEPYCKQDGNICQNITLNDIKKRYSEIRSRNDIFFVASGKILQKNLLAMLEKSFGKLEYLPCEETDIPYKITGSKVKLKLDRIFYSDKTAEDAPKYAPLLIPTEKFTDPVYVFFEMPEYGTKEYILTRLMLLELEDLIKAQAEKTKFAEDAETGVFLLKKPFAYIHFLEVENPKNIIPNLQNAYNLFREFRKNLTNDDIKALYIRKILSESQTNRGEASLITESYLFSKNPIQYLDFYKIIEDSTVDEIYDIFESWNKNASLLWVTSQESSL